MCIRDRVEDCEEARLIDIRVIFNEKYNREPGGPIRNLVFRNIRYQGEGGKMYPMRIKGYDADNDVRGTTLKESIIRILDRLHPKKIVLVSSSPQVRYPDYYGIDMSNMDEFIAFRAAVELLKERGMAHVVGEVYEQCKMQMGLPKEEMANSVKAIYAPFTDEDISRKMVEMLRPAGVTTPIEIVYQTLEGLHEACPEHSGDWYFSGDYPTPGGVKLVNLSLIHI